MIERYLLIMLAVIFTGSIGAFFLFVAILPVVGVASVLTGLAAMFALGYYVGHNPGAITELLSQAHTGRADQNEPIAIPERSVDAVSVAS
jgi:hypothetical protein